MSDPTRDDEDQKRFKVIEVTPEELDDAAKKAGRGAWNISDRWPGSSAIGGNSAKGGRTPESRRGDIAAVVVTTTTTIRFVNRGDEEDCQSNEGRGRSSWFKQDTWPGSDARNDNVGRGASAPSAAENMRERSVDETYRPGESEPVKKTIDNSKEEEG
ncbi:MAG: hypothetical protein V4857_08810 [Pseudomonadota bacterium]